jgi:hypothetical protein
LGCCGVVQINKGLAVYALVKKRELFTNLLFVEGLGCQFHFTKKLILRFFVFSIYYTPYTCEVCWGSESNFSRKGYAGWQTELEEGQGAGALPYLLCFR